MAKAKKTEEIKTEDVKTVKGGMRDLPPTDFTYYDKPLMAYVRLNKMCVVGVFVDIDNAQVEGVIFDELNSTTYSFSAAIE